MREDTSFTDRKLTAEEFAAKYGSNGTNKYQYHTMQIEDGRDEREQLIINNIRALWETFEFLFKYRKIKDPRQSDDA